MKLKSGLRSFKLSSQQIDQVCATALGAHMGPVHDTTMGVYHGYGRI